MQAGIDFRFRGVLIITEMLKRKKKHYKKLNPKYLSQNNFNPIF
jgi:hypothetical protein